MTQAIQAAAAGGAHYEAGLLARIASAPTQREQFRLAAELEAFRADRASQLRQAAGVDLSIPALARLRPTAATEPWAPTTADSDWLSEVEPDAHDLGEVTQAMTAQASTWYSRTLHPAVRAYPGEVMAQADGAASRAAGQYGTAYPVAHRAFTDHVAHLVSRTAEQVPPASTLPAGVSNDDTFDALTWSDTTVRPKADGTSPSDTPSLGEGSPPAGDVAQGVEDTVSETGHDAGPQGLQHSVDYLDGTTTAPTNSSGATTMNTASRGLAGHAARFLGSLRPLAASPIPADLAGAPPAAGDPSQLGQADADVPCPQCGGQGLTAGVPCPLCGGAGMVTADQAAQYQAEQAPPQGPPGPAQPVASRRAHRRTADSVAPLPSSRGDLTESLDDGDEPEGDHPASGERLVSEVGHDAGPGNEAATDYLDASQYAWPGTARRRHASPMVPSAMPGAPLGAASTGDPGMPADPAAGGVDWEAQAAAGLDDQGLGVLRQAVQQVGWGDTPLAGALSTEVQRRANASPAVAPDVPGGPVGPVDAARLAAFRRSVAARTTGKVDKRARAGQRRAMTNTAGEVRDPTAEEICLDCNGTGVWDMPSKGAVVPCDTCGGTGLAEPSLAVKGDPRLRSADQHLASIKRNAAEIHALAGGVQAAGVYPEYNSEGYPIEQPSDPNGPCDYCGRPGHQWQVHPEAVADVAAVQRGQGRSGYDGQAVTH